MTDRTLRLLSLVLILSLGVGCYAQPAAPQAPQLSAASPEVIQWLDKLEACGREIQTLQANAVYEKINHLLADEQTRIGELTYAAANAEQKTPARFAIDFKQTIVNDQLREEPVQWIFDGEWLVEKQAGRKLFVKRQVVAPGQTFDPLKIDGPFPLPIGQKRDEVLSRFDVKIMPNAEADEKTLHLRLTPRDQAQVGPSKFKQVDLWFDRQTLLPTRVITLDDAENETKVNLSKMRVNELPAADVAQRFDTTSPAPGSGWRVEIHRFEDARVGP